ncbi:MAG TPA: hypothetical protein VGE01_02215 [Fimbriimonas sp.]
MVVSLLILVFGCGGGGGGGDDGGNGGNGGYTRIQVVALSAGKYIDTENLRPGQTVQMRLIGYNSANELTVLNATNWRTNAPASVATINASGSLTAVATSNTAYTVSATFEGKTYSAPLRVRNSVATVTGKVRTSGGKAVGGATIVFYDGPGEFAREVGRTRVAVDGTFRAQLPASAKTFSVDLSDLTGYWDQFFYNGGEYSTVTPGCYADLPNFTTGQTVALPADIVLRAKTGGPPPPPPGCFE